jgi:hypothetical protein
MESDDSMMDDLMSADVIQIACNKLEYKDSFQYFIDQQAANNPEETEDRGNLASENNKLLDKANQSTATSPWLSEKDKFSVKSFDKQISREKQPVLAPFLTEEMEKSQSNSKTELSFGIIRNHETEEEKLSEIVSRVLATEPVEDSKIASTKIATFVPVDEVTSISSVEPQMSVLKGKVQISSLMT